MAAQGQMKSRQDISRELDLMMKSGKIDEQTKMDTLADFDQQEPTQQPQGGIISEQELAATLDSQGVDPETREATLQDYRDTYLPKPTPAENFSKLSKAEQQYAGGLAKEHDVTKGKSLEGKSTMDILQKAGENLPGSMKQQIGETVYGSTIGIFSTLYGLGGMAAGAAAKLIPGEQDVEKFVDDAAAGLEESYGGMNNLLTTFMNEPARVYDDLTGAFEGFSSLRRRGQKYRAKKAGATPIDAKQGRHWDTTGTAVGTVAGLNKIVDSKFHHSEWFGDKFRGLAKGAQEKMLTRGLNFSAKNAQALENIMNSKVSNDMSGLNRVQRQAKKKGHANWFVENGIFDTPGGMLNSTHQILDAHDGRLSNLLSMSKEKVYSPKATALVNYLESKAKGVPDLGAVSDKRRGNIKSLQGMKDVKSGAPTEGIQGNSLNNMYTPLEIHEIRQKFDRETRAEAQRHYGEGRPTDTPIKEGEGIKHLFELRDDVMREIEDNAWTTDMIDGSDVKRINQNIRAANAAARGLDESISRSGRRAALGWSDYMLATGASGVTPGFTDRLSSVMFGTAALATKKILETPYMKMKFAEQLQKLNKSELDDFVDAYRKGDTTKTGKYATFIGNNLRKNMGPLLFRIEMTRQKEEREKSILDQRQRMRAAIRKDKANR